MKTKQMMLVHMNEQWFGQTLIDDTVKKLFHWEFNQSHTKLTTHLICTTFLELQPPDFYLVITISKKWDGQ